MSEIPREDHPFEAGQANQEREKSEMTETVGRLQQYCAAAFTDVMESLAVGMSERDIAGALRAKLASQGVYDYWYEVPFNVLIGVERFHKGLTTPDYAVKAPSPAIALRAGQIVYADFSPMDATTGIWGDWSSTCVFRPDSAEGQQQLAFLEEMRALQRQGIARITARTRGAEVAQYYLNEYTKQGVTLLDVRNNVGHSIHAGPKSQTNRIWLDLNNNQPLGSGIFTVEPGGIKEDDQLVARFEECIYIPESGTATIIGGDQSVPLAFW